jgi:hypothetical protein
MEFGFCRSIEFNTQHNQYVLVMAKQFSKWLELVLWRVVINLGFIGLNLEILCTYNE